jgi:hypothetical protein
MPTKEHFTTADFEGVFYKQDSYRSTCQGCGRGYHGHRWDAHHILPAVSFQNIEDEFAISCLRITPFNINDKPCMGGLPKLTAFILALQSSMPMTPAQRKAELTITMKRWGTVDPYKADVKRLGKVFAFPGNFPVHNPVNWGHTIYNDEVTTYMNDMIFKPLKRGKPHPEPKSVQGALETAVTTHWTILTGIANGPGGGAHVGTKANLENRYGTAKNGWWKPLCMTKSMPSAPASP